MLLNEEGEVVVPAPVLVVSSKVLDPHHSVTTSSGALGTVVRLGGAVLGFKRPHFYFFVFINVTAICF